MGVAEFPSEAWTRTVITRSKAFIPDSYRIMPVAPSGAYYLAAMTLGDRDVFGQPVEFTSGSVPLKVIFRSDGGAIRGTVEECGNATIAIAPEDPVSATCEFRVHLPSLSAPPTAISNSEICIPDATMRSLSTN